MSTLTITGSPTFNGDGSVTIDSTGNDHISASSSFMNQVQGYAVFRYRLGTLDAAQHNMAIWFSSVAGFIQLMFANGSIFINSSDGTGQLRNAVVTGATQGSTHTATFTWTQTELRAASDGGAFSTSTRLHIPSNMLSTFDIGSVGLSQWLNGDLLWMAMGSSKLEQQNVTWFNNLADDITVAGYPIVYDFFWDCTSSSYDLFVPTAPTVAIGRKSIHPYVGRNAL